MNKRLPLIAITMGDPVGIGPEIIARALVDPRVHKCCRPIVYGDAARLRAGAASAGLRMRFVEASSLKDACRSHDPIGVVNPAATGGGELKWARPTTASGMAMMAYLERAIDDAIAGRVSAIATGPINKRALKLAHIPFPGHTEILAQRTGTLNYAMMLAGDRLKVVLATLHIPIKRIPQELTTAGVMTIVALTDQSLKTRFGLSAPHIAVAGLNPHAGESGLFGDEEERIIAPAIALAASHGTTVTGPHPPDTIFHRASQGAYDAVVAMYHDQGLGPFKMIHFDDGVNTTLGLPIVRTSVDHGTAYDIAGKGLASPRSMVAAIGMAAEQVRWLQRTPTP